MRDDAAADAIKAIVVGDMHDNGRNYHFADLLSHHNVDLYHLAEDLEVNGTLFEQNKAFVIPLQQTEYRFRSEEHTSELQSRGHLVCRLLLEKKNIEKRDLLPT